MPARVSGLFLCRGNPSIQSTTMSITHDPKTNEITVRFKLPAQPGISKSSGKANNCGGTGGFVPTTAQVV